MKTFPPSSDALAAEWQRQECAMGEASPDYHYRIVAEVLAEPLDIDLPSDFAAHLERRAYSTRGRVDDDRREAVAIGAGGVLCCVLMLVLAPADVFAWLTPMASGGWTAAAAAGLLLAAVAWPFQRRAAQA